MCYCTDTMHTYLNRYMYVPRRGSCWKNQAIVWAQPALMRARPRPKVAEVRITPCRPPFDDRRVRARVYVQSNNHKKAEAHVQSNNQKKAEAQYHQISLGQMLDREHRHFDAGILVYGSIQHPVNLIFLLYLIRDCRQFDFCCSYSRLHNQNITCSY